MAIIAHLSAEDREKYNRLSAKEKFECLKILIDKRDLEQIEYFNFTEDAVAKNSDDVWFISTGKDLREKGITCLDDIDKALTRQLILIDPYLLIVRDKMSRKRSFESELDAILNKTNVNKLR